MRLKRSSRNLLEYSRRSRNQPNSRFGCVIEVHLFPPKSRFARHLARSYSPRFLYARPQHVNKTFQQMTNFDSLKKFCLEQLIFARRFFILFLRPFKDSCTLLNTSRENFGDFHRYRIHFIVYNLIHVPSMLSNSKNNCSMQIFRRRSFLKFRVGLRRIPYLNFRTYLVICWIIEWQNKFITKTRDSIISFPVLSTNF